MPDYIDNIVVGNKWKDISTSFAPGTEVSIQNLGGARIRIFFGPDAPDELSDNGIILPPENWPLHYGVIGTKIWAKGDSTVHISEIG